MREVARFDERGQAEAFSDFLMGEEIGNEFEKEDNGTWSVWVHDDDQLEEAGARLIRFQQNPAAQSVRESAGKSREARQEKKRARRQSKARQIDMRTAWARKSLKTFDPLTLGLIAFIVALNVVIYTVPRDLRPLDALDLTVTAEGVPVRFPKSLEVPWSARIPEILRGQVWRVVTPVAVHARFMTDDMQFRFVGVIHLLFNMYWLYYFGLQIERYQRWWTLLELILGIGVFSVMVSWLLFGEFGIGFSGVNYGLFGYTWVFSRYNPNARIHVDPGAARLLGIWFILCWLGWMSIANWGHTTGLLAGSAVGYIVSGQPKRHWRRLEWKMKGGQ